MNFLNSGKGYKLYAYEAQKEFYADKSMMIQGVYDYVQRSNKYICITRPRRFGKTTAANMIAAFFDAGCKEKGKELFENLEIGVKGKDHQKPSCWEKQGELNVIRINMIELITERTTCYQDFINTLHRLMLEDLQSAYSNIPFDLQLSVPEALDRTGDEFAFVIDEWDAIFEMPFMSKEEKQAYILFLKALLKDRSYVRFAYMTGILPIAKYSSGSPLNMFDEFSVFQDEVFYPYFGLTRGEIQCLMEKKGNTKPALEELTFWYDGYIREVDGEHLFNPNSVSKALANGRCRSHWTGTGPMNEVRDLIRHNVKDLRQDVIRMAGGETLQMKLTGFDVEQTRISTKDEILSAMVVYGFLSYHEQSIRIPNHELALKFQEALSSEPLGLNQTISASKELLDATLQQQDAKVAKLMEILHDEKVPFFQYNDENSLACVVTVGYLAALDDYRISREDKAGKGYVDFCFTPMRKGDLPIILELKYNRSAKNAIQCIHQKEYINRYQGYPKVLLVGMNYSTKTKKHTCLTELAEPYACLTPEGV